MYNIKLIIDFKKKFHKWLCDLMTIILDMNINSQIFYEGMINKHVFQGIYKEELQFILELTIIFVWESLDFELPLTSISWYDTHHFVTKVTEISHQNYLKNSATAVTELEGNIAIHIKSFSGWL